MTRKPKRPLALWTRTYPDQAKKLMPERKPRKLRRRSIAMSKRMKEYAKLKEQFLQDNPQCQVFPWICECNQFRPATQIHHIRGRAGSLLLDTRFWMAVSQEGHEFIHKNPELARKHGYLCAKGQWNKPVPI